MLSVAQETPKMVPNPVAVKVAQKFLEQTALAFEEGLIQDAGDWGIVAAHLHAFAHYLEEGEECGTRNESFREGFIGEVFRPSLSKAITSGCEKVWNEIAPSFIAEQQGR